MKNYASNTPTPTFETMYPDLKAVGLAIIDYGRKNELTPAQLSEIFHLGIAAKFAANS